MPHITPEETRELLTAANAREQGDDPADLDCSDPAVQDQYLPDRYDEFERYHHYRSLVFSALLVNVILILLYPPVGIFLAIVGFLAFGYLTERAHNAL